MGAAHNGGMDTVATSSNLSKLCKGGMTSPMMMTSFAYMYYSICRGGEWEIELQVKVKFKKNKKNMKNEQIEDIWFIFFCFEI